MDILIVACGGAIGAVLRYVLMSIIGSRTLFGLHLPYSTLTVNIIGSFLMGVIIEFLARQSSGGQNIHLFFAVGMLGSFTTFSTFSLDVVYMMQRSEIIPMLLYVVTSVVVSIVALFCGLHLTKVIL